MDGFRSLNRSLIEAAALSLLATALLFVPPAQIAPRLDGWLFDTWSQLTPPPAPTDIVLVDVRTPDSLTTLAKLAKRHSAQLLITTEARRPATRPATDLWIGPTEVPLGDTRSRPTQWPRGGHLWFAPDVDGVIRRDQALIGDGGTVPSLPCTPHASSPTDHPAATVSDPSPDQRLRFSAARSILSRSKSGSCSTNPSCSSKRHHRRQRRRHSRDARRPVELARARGARPRELPRTAVARVGGSRHSVAAGASRCCCGAARVGAWKTRAATASWIGALDRRAARSVRARVRRFHLVTDLGSRCVATVDGRSC